MSLSSERWQRPCVYGHKMETEVVIALDKEMYKDTEENQRLPLSVPSLLLLCILSWFVHLWLPQPHFYHKSEVVHCSFHCLQDFEEHGPCKQQGYAVITHAPNSD